MFKELPVALLCAYGSPHVHVVTASDHVVTACDC